MLYVPIRSEYYSDFGWALGGKFASQYTISEKFAVRGAINSGFRAPSLPQLYFGSTFNDVVTVDTRSNGFGVTATFTKEIGTGKLSSSLAFNYNNMYI